MENPESVLVVDDDESNLRVSSRILEQAGFKVQPVESGIKAVELLEHSKFDLVVTDIVMPRVSGFEVIVAALKSNPEAICIAMTGHGSLDSAVDALRFGAYSYLVKPFDPNDLKHCIQKGLEKQRLTKELRQRNAELEKLNRELDMKVQEATTELRDLNHRMLTEMASLKEVDALKSSFLNNVSHDLKSPLTTLQGYVSFLLESLPKNLSPDVQLSLKNTSKAASHMAYLINQLLDAAKLTSGKVKLVLEKISVPEILEESAALVRGQADSKGIYLEVRQDFDSPPPLRADRGRLLQILSNLLGNACKFTPAGGKVTLRVWPEDSTVHFCTPSKQFKGLGLGLRIARDLVDLHHGKIWAESAIGHGSKFHIILPN